LLKNRSIIKKSTETTFQCINKIKTMILVSIILLVIIPITSSNTSLAQIQNYLFVTKWGSHGSGDGQFIGPSDIAIDSSDNVFVVDVLNSRIQKFTNNGTFIAKWGSHGSGDGQFIGPSDIAIDSSDNVFVVDRIDNNIQKFTNNGTFIAKWGSTCSIEEDNDNNCNSHMPGAIELGDGQFNEAQGIAADSTDNIYVSDRGNSRIQKFTNNGTFIAKWGERGTDDGQFNPPGALAADSTDNIYVSDVGNSRIQKFTNNGTFIAKWGSYCDLNTGFGCNILNTGILGDGQFNDPQGIAADSTDNIYVSDIVNQEIQVFSSSFN
jgi:hypothetical protein